MKFIHEAVQIVSRGLAVMFLILLVSCFVLKKTVLGLGKFGWFYMLLGLIIGPGIVTNLIFKDQWDRARPIHIEEFGGNKTFTPAAFISDQCEKNCSFISGDPAFGFYLHSFAYVVRRRARRLVFWSGMGLGGALGVLRVGMGGHFFSDVIFAALFMLICSWGLFRVMNRIWPQSNSELPRSC